MTQPAPAPAPAHAPAPSRDPARSRRLMMLKLCLVGVSTLLSLVLAELAVRVAAPQNLSGTWRMQDASGLAVNRPNHSARHQHSTRVVSYETDGQGLRTVGSGQGDVRILCLGDSFTFGWLLEEADTFVARLQQAADAEFGADAVTLLNAGHGGWGLADYVRFLEEYQDTLQPDGVVLFLNTGDIGRSLESSVYRLVGESGLDVEPVDRPRESRLKSLSNRVPGYQWLLEHSHLFQLARNAAAGQGSFRRSAPPAAEAPVLKSSTAYDPELARRCGHALMHRLKVLTLERGVPVQVLTTGFHHQQGPPQADSTEPTQAFMARAVEILAEEGLPYVDCSAELHARIEGDYASITIAGDGHPNEAGAALIAELNWPGVREFVRQLRDRPEGFPAEAQP